MKSGFLDRRKVAAGLIALTCVCSNATLLNGLSVSAAPAVTLPGDVDTNGTVDAKDAVLLQQYLLRKNESVSDQGLVNADLTGDSAINALDLTMLKRSLLPAQSEGTYIHLQNSTITVEGSNAILSNSNKTVTITASGSYYVDGTLADGQIIVNVPDTTADAETVKIFLNGVNITGVSAAPILIENAENTSLNLVSGTENFLYDGATYAENTATIYAKDDMTIKGDGKLTITAATQYGIHCNNDLKITGGVINVVTENETTKMDGIRAKQTVTIKGGDVSVNATGDGIKSTKADVAISDGNISIKAGNDAIQAETTIDISGGTVVASGDRGLTSITATNITGGTVCATATDNQMELVSATQGCMLLSYAAEWSKDSEITVKSGTTTVASAVSRKKFSYALISAPAMSATASYSLYTGDSQMQHSTGTDGTFKMTAANTSFLAVAALSGGSITPTAAGIYLSGSALTASGTGVAQTSSTVATINAPGEYTLSGSMEGGKIIVDVDKTAYPDGEVNLILDGITLTNTADSPIYVASIGGECSITAKKGTENTISDGTSYTNADSDTGAIYALDDLKIKGQGKLTVNGNCQDGIVSKDDLKIWNGTLTVNAVDDCLRGKDSVKIGDADDTDYSALNVSLTSTAGDCIKASNETDAGEGIVLINGGQLTLKACYDGIQAVSDLTVNGGTLDIYTFQGSAYTGTSGSTSGPGGGWGGMGDGNSNKVENSAKGLKSAGTLTVNGGTITVDASDDALHCAGNMTIADGAVTVQSADDGLHADADLTIQGGKVTVTKSYEGIEGSNIYVSGGEVRATASDDGFNAAGGTDSSGTQNPGGWNPGGGMSGGNQQFTISGGYVFVNAGGDGLDSNGAITISGGVAVVSGPTNNGNSPVDCNSSVSFTGGELFAVGATGMMSEGYPSNATYLNSTSMNASAGSIVAICNGSNVISAFKVPKTSAGLIYCNSATNVSSCTVYKDVTLNGCTLNADGYGTGGTYSGGTQVTLGGSGGNTPWGW